MRLPLTLEMTATLEDLRRLLPAAVGHVPFVEEDGAFVHREGERGWRISVSPLPPLQAGLMRLERQRLEFRFDGYPDDEIEGFMKRFEVYFRRGGG
jgi:hypothetical protein